MTKNVVFDESGAARIVAAVKYYEGLQNPADPVPDENYEQSGRSVIRGMFTGVWNIGQTHTVYFTADNGGAGTKNAQNYFATVGEENTTRNCVIILVGPEWVLIAAQCEDMPPVENVVD